MKQDFAIRSGLIPEQRIFGDEQLIEIYRCCADTLDAGYDLTYDQEKRIKGIQEQIEYIELGRILVDTGYKNFPESVQPYLDYRAIGGMLYSYTSRKEMTP